MACSYCVPEEYIHQQQVPDIIYLSKGKPEKRIDSESLSEIIKALHNELALKKVRFTGGEPLLHPQLPFLIRQTRSHGIENIGLTTNGFLLALKAKELKAAGLQSVNISIDAIDRETFKRITKKDYLNRVIQGIDSALEAGLEVQLNVVIMQGINHHQVLPLLKFALKKGLTLRFIELMKMGHLYESDTSLFYPASEILKDIKREHKIEELTREHSSTARYWYTDSGGKFGIIANETFPFCSDCDRLRLDEYGTIYGCISSNEGFNLSKYLTDSVRLNEQLAKALQTKQPIRFKGSKRNMIVIGG